MRMSSDDTLNSVITLLDQLPSAPNAYQALQNLKTTVFAIHPAALQQVVPNISFNIIFEFLETDDLDQIEVCCSLLSRLLAALPPAAIMSDFSAELSLGLAHPNPHVYNLTLDCIHRCCLDSAATMVLARRTDLLKPLIQGLCSDDGDVSKRIRQALVAFGQHLHGRESLLAGEASLTLKSVEGSSSTNRYRVFECVVGVSSHSQSALELCSTCGFLDDLLVDLDDDGDLLVQLNCVSLLADLSTFEHGLRFLERIGTVAKMEALLGQADANPMVSFLLPGIVKFFGNLMYVYPEQTSTKWAPLVKKVVEFVPQPDPALSLAAIDTLGLIGASPIGKTALHSIGGHQLNLAVQHLGNLIFSGATDSNVKIRAMEAASHLLRLPPQTQDPNLSNLCQSWFVRLTALSPATEIMRLCHLPFSNIRLAALQMVRSIADQPWGQAALKDHPGFQEYILDRSTESEFEGWNAKFEIIKTMVEASQVTRNVFGDPYFVRLKGYILEGALFQSVETEVATMEM